MAGWYPRHLFPKEEVDVTMVENQELRKRLQRVSGLLNELEQIADSKCRAAARELVQTLMDVHSAALERILEKVFEAGDAGSRVIDDLAADPIVAGLLVLYGLHPEPLEIRVDKAMQRIAPSLRAHGVEARFISIENADIRISIKAGAHTCGSSSSTAKTLIEDAIYESAPELSSLVIEGAEAKSASGFVSLGALVGTGRSATPGENVVTSASGD
jgi:Fe-S cluster biogenesis protein NfuA